MSIKTDLVVLPSMLNYRRSVSTGRGLFSVSSTPDGADKVPLIVEEMGLTGSRAYDIWQNIDRQKSKNNAVEVGIESIASPNPHRLEVAFIPEDKPFLHVSFSLMYCPNSFTPHMCNSRPIRAALMQLAGLYRNAGGYESLAKKYALPLITGHWMWRNNDEAVTRRVSMTERRSHGMKWAFDVHHGASSFNDVEPVGDSSSIDELVEAIARGLSGSGPLLSMDVTACYEMMSGMQAYPSQSLLIDEKDTHALKRLLYKVDTPHAIGQAAFHEQKIGNALRTIDDWHGDTEYGAIAVEPNGVVSRDFLSLRVVNRRDFYSLLRTKLTLWLKELEAGNLDEVTDVEGLHFVVAVLIRGGAFV